MRRAIARGTIGLQYVAGIMSAFGVLALVLAVSGVYGMLSYRVSLRTTEIGVRMALGATRRDVLGLTLGQAARLSAIGLAAGAALAFGTGRLLSSALRGAVSVGPGVVGMTTVALALAAARRGLGPVPARDGHRARDRAALGVARMALVPERVTSGVDAPRAEGRGGGGLARVFSVLDLRTIDRPRQGRRMGETVFAHPERLMSRRRAISAAARRSWREVVTGTTVVRDLSTVICLRETPPGETTPRLLVAARLTYHPSRNG